MESVKDNEKNRAKVERKFNVEVLEVIVDKEGLATFFNGGEIIGFKGNKSKEEDIKSVEVTLIN